MKVKQSQGFNIAFHEPKCWWMPMDILLDSQVISFQASGVLNDPMEEIVAAGCSLLDGREAVSVVNLWREPKWHSLLFEPSMNSEQVFVTLQLNQGDDMSASETEFCVSTSLLAVCQNILRAYQRILDDIGVDVYEAPSGWARPFPGSAMAELVRLFESATP